MMTSARVFGVIFAATALVGVGYAGCQVFPLAMLPDVAASEEDFPRPSGLARLS